MHALTSEATLPTSLALCRAYLHLRRCDNAHKPATQARQETPGACVQLSRYSPDAMTRRTSAAIRSASRSPGRGGGPDPDVELGPGRRVRAGRRARCRSAGSVPVGGVGAGRRGQGWELSSGLGVELGPGRWAGAGRAAGSGLGLGLGPVVEPGAAGFRLGGSRATTPPRPSRAVTTSPARGRSWKLSGTSPPPTVCCHPSVVTGLLAPLTLR
jgi:hypothetical protein